VVVVVVLYLNIAQTYMQTNINVHATNIPDKWTLENRLAERTRIVSISKSLQHTEIL